MLFREVRLSGLLSFGPDGVSLPMKPLNVLIGPNGSGKSNFLEAIALFRAAPGEVTAPISRNGGILEWRWKGERPVAALRLDARLDVPGVGEVQHEIVFGERERATVVTEERLKCSVPDGPENSPNRYSRPPWSATLLRRIARVTEGRGEDATKKRETAERVSRRSRRTARSVDYAEDFRPKESILRFAATPDHALPWRLKEQYEGIRMYRNWSFGPSAEVRFPASAHDPSDSLEEGAGNLALVLSHLQGEQKRKFLKAAGELFDGIVDFRCPVTGGVVSLFLEEGGGRTIPASRLSDGTLRYLSLLAILLHPEPPPVICIEEPELGLHPDLLPALSDLMREASARSQLVVTTHSDLLVDTLTEEPEAVVVCEKEEGQTTMRRLERDDLAEWLEKYRLGALWSSGELGGNRW